MPGIGNSISRYIGSGGDGFIPFNGSPFAMQYDPIDECANLDTAIPKVIGIDQKGAVGMYAKIPDITANPVQCFWSVSRSTDTTRILLYTLDDGKLYAQCVKGGSTRWIKSTDAAVLVNNVVTHIGIDHDTIEPTLRVNGAAPPQGFSVSNDITAWIKDLDALPDKCTIGAGNDSNNGYKFFAGATIDEFVWYRDTLSGAEWAEWYNGGVALDMSTHSKGRPFAWLRQGEASVYSGEWTSTDQGTGGNTAVSINMEVGDRVTGLA